MMVEFLDKAPLGNGPMLLLCSIALALACAVLCVSVSRGNLIARSVIGTSCRALLLIAGCALCGFLLSLIPAKGIWSKVIYYAAVVSAIFAALFIFVRGMRAQVRTATANALRKSAGPAAAARFAKGWLFALSAVAAAAAALALACGHPLYWLPMCGVALTAVALSLGSLFLPRVWYAAAAIAIAAFAFLTLSRALAAASCNELYCVVPAAAAVALALAAFVSLTVRKE